MAETKSSISNAQSYREIGEFWDSHDLGDFEGQTRPADFEVRPQSSSIYVALEKNLAQRLRSAAESRGVSPDKLLSLWLEEKIAEDSRRK